LFLAALLFHGADHVRRGFDVITPWVFWAGNLQLTLALVAVGLVFLRSWWGPLAAVAIGLPSAIGFTAAHVLPHWSAFSDPFTGTLVAPHVTGMSWAAALAEIAADIAFAAAGYAVLRMRQTRAAWPSSSTSPMPT
jgi:hypothetical protein